MAMIKTIAISQFHQISLNSVITIFAKMLENTGSTRTHLTYQLIIITLVLLGLGFHEFISACQALTGGIILYIVWYNSIIVFDFRNCFRFINWANAELLDSISMDKSKSEDAFNTPPKPLREELEHVREKISLPEEKTICKKEFKRRDGSASSLSGSPKLPLYPKKSKSWVNLSETSPLSMKSKEGSLEVLNSLSEKKLRNPFVSRKNKELYLKERTNKAKSWKMGLACPDLPKPFVSENMHQSSFQQTNNLESSSNMTEESELSKSYSFPFRQKRLETWLEMKETETRESNNSLDMPYWQTVGYNLAVKYEARRRRAVSTSTEEAKNEYESPEIERSTEVPKEKPNPKKLVKTAAGSQFVNKLKLGFSNLISKGKKDLQGNLSVCPKSLSKTSALSKVKIKNIQPLQTKIERSPKPLYPQFLSNDRPQIFYPKYIPFEKERFESDVRKKILELADERDNLYGT